MCIRRVIQIHAHAALFHQDSWKIGPVVFLFPNKQINKRHRNITSFVWLMHRSSCNAEKIHSTNRRRKGGRKYCCWLCTTVALSEEQIVKLKRVCTWYLKNTIFTFFYCKINTNKREPDLCTHIKEINSIIVTSDSKYRQGFTLIMLLDYVSSSVKLPFQGLSINPPSPMTTQFYDEEGSLLSLKSS